MQTKRQLPWHRGVALSPLGNRIAYVDLANTVQVYEMNLTKRLIPGAVTLVREDANHIGFYDQDHVVAGGGSGDAVMWAATRRVDPVPADDPWAVVGYVTSMLHQPLVMTNLVDGFAVADQLVVTGFGGALALDDITRTRYLGWQATGAGTLAHSGTQQVMMVTPSRFVWLDDKLAAVRDVDFRPDTRIWVNALPIDEHHVVTQTVITSAYGYSPPRSPPEGHYDLALVDLDTKANVVIGRIDVDRMEYSPESHLLAVTNGHTIRRYQLDVATNTVHELMSLRIHGSAISVSLFDPASADGITAAVTGWDSDYANSQTLTLYRDKGKPVRIHPFDGTPLETRADGTLFAFYRTGKTPEVRALKGKAPSRKIPVPGALTAAINHDASRIAYVAGDDVVMLDAAGAEVWRQPLWSAAQVMFSADGSRLFVRASGGIAVLDAATGIRTALECGWNFGVTETPIETNPMGVAPVCEDPMLQ